MGRIYRRIYRSDLKTNPNITPGQYAKSNGARKEKGQGHYVAQAKGKKQQLNYYSDLKHNPNETPGQYAMSKGATNDKGHGHYVAQTKGRKQSLVKILKVLFVLVFCSEILEH